MKKSNSRIKFEENLRTIIDLYWNKTRRVEDIAAKFSIGASTLRRYMSNLHLLHRVGWISSKYNVDESFFETIDTEKQAYWLGVLFADGCVMHIRNTKYIVFSSIDKEWVEQFKKDISFTGPVLTEHHKKYNRDIYKVKITSKKLYRDLVEKGIIERKSIIMVFPSTDIIPDHLTHHFIRGYFDGDGTVGVYQNKKTGSWKRLHVSFSCGSVQFITSLKDTLIKNGVFPVGKIRQRKNSNVYMLDLSLIAGLRFKEYIYKNATIYLQRKYNKIMSAEKPKRTFNDYNRVSSVEDKGIVCSHMKV